MGLKGLQLSRDLHMPAHHSIRGGPWLAAEAHSTACSDHKLTLGSNWLPINNNTYEI